MSNNNNNDDDNLMAYGLMRFNAAFTKTFE